MPTNNGKSREVFAKNLAHYLAMANMSQADLVKKMGYKPATVSDWINGKKFPRIDVIEALAELFDVNKSDLLEDGYVQAQRAMAESLTELLRKKLGRPPTIDELASLNQLIDTFCDHILRTEK